MAGKVDVRCGHGRKGRHQKLWVWQGSEDVGVVGRGGDRMDKQRGGSEGVWQGIDVAEMTREEEKLKQDTKGVETGRQGGGKENASE